jgi:hypothetical protein
MKKHLTTADLARDERFHRISTERRFFEPRSVPH